VDQEVAEVAEVVEVAQAQAQVQVLAPEEEDPNS
jgi:hypothetical protein